MYGFHIILLKHLYFDTVNMAINKMSLQSLGHKCSYIYSQGRQQLLKSGGDTERGSEATELVWEEGVGGGAGPPPTVGTF